MGNSSLLVAFVMTVLGPVTACSTVSEKSPNSIELDNLTEIAKKICQSSFVEYDGDQPRLVKGIELNLGRIAKKAFEEKSEPHFIYDLSVDLGNKSALASDLTEIIRECVELEKLDIAGLKVGKLDFIRSSKIEFLDLSFTGIDDEAIDWLLRLESLETLKLSGNKHKAEILDKLCRISTLRHVALDGMQVSAKELDRFLSNANLKTVQIRGNQLLDDDARKKLQHKHDVSIEIKWTDVGGIL